MYPRDPITLSEDDWGVESPKRNAKYLGGIIHAEHWIPRTIPNKKTTHTYGIRFDGRSKFQLSGQQFCSSFFVVFYFHGNWVVTPTCNPNMGI